MSVRERMEKILEAKDSGVSLKKMRIFELNKKWSELTSKIHQLNTLRVDPPGRDLLKEIDQLKKEVAAIEAELDRRGA